VSDVTDRIGNVTRPHHEPLVTQARELIAHVPRAQFVLVLGDMGLDIERMRPVRKNDALGLKPCQEQGLPGVPR
jgi:hypothetical protein